MSDNIRLSKTDYYLNIAADVAKRGTCLRRNYGAVIVRNDEIIATGYTGAPRGSMNCSETGICRRQELNIPSGERYELCRSVHAEQNAIISAARADMIGATLYLFGWEMQDGKFYKPVDRAEPCLLCKRMIVNAGIIEVISYDNAQPDSQKSYYRQSPGIWVGLDKI